MSIPKAQSAALAEGLLDSLGSAPPSTRAGALPIIEEMLGRVALEFMDRAVANLDKAAAVDTGELSTQLTFTVEILGDAYVLSVGYPEGSTAAKYYDFVNKGVQGTEGGPASEYKFKTAYPSKKMATAILKWVRRQGLSARNDFKRQTISGSAIQRTALGEKRASIKKMADEATRYKSLAYAIATNIKKKGRSATHFFDDAVTDLMSPATIEALQLALAADVRLQIRQAFAN